MSPLAARHPQRAHWRRGAASQSAQASPKSLLATPNRFAVFERSDEEDSLYDVIVLVLGSKHFYGKRDVMVKDLHPDG